MEGSCKSPELLAFELIDKESPETDLCSSSPPLVGDIGSRPRDIMDIERSKGESGIKTDYQLKLYVIF